MAMKLTPRGKKDEGDKPDAIMLSDHFGWTENGVLRRFHEGQIVSDPRDIEDLLKRGAPHKVVIDV